MHFVKDDTGDADNEDGASPLPSYTMYAVLSKHADPLVMTLRVNGAPLRMEVDTGTSRSILSESTYHNLWAEGQAPRLRSSEIQLRTYTGESIEIVGAIDVEVEFKGQLEQLCLHVVKGDGPTLLGRDWLRKIKLDWKEMHSVHASPPDLESILTRHSAVFKDELGTLRGTSARMHIDRQATPRFCRARPVPYSLRSKIVKELERLQHDGVIKPVQFADWAAPIVPVPKKDGSVRLCGDFKLTVN